MKNHIEEYSMRALGRLARPVHPQNQCIQESTCSSELISYLIVVKHQRDAVEPFLFLQVCFQRRNHILVHRRTNRFPSHHLLPSCFPCGCCSFLAGRCCGFCCRGIFCLYFWSTRSLISCCLLFGRLVCKQQIMQGVTRASDHVAGYVSTNITMSVSPTKFCLCTNRQEGLKKSFSVCSWHTSRQQT